jgi:serine/threonine protein kinase
LLRAGIETSVPLAVIERGHPRRESWLFSEYLPDLIDLEHWILTRLANLPPSVGRARKLAVIEALAELVRRLKAAALVHRDLKASNLLISEADQGLHQRAQSVAVPLKESPRRLTLDAARQGRASAARWRLGIAHGHLDPVKLFIVDLDGLRRRGIIDRLRPNRTLTRLAASLVDQPVITRTDYGRFLRAFAQGSGDEKLVWKHNFRVLSRKARRTAQPSARQNRNGP